MINFVRVSRQKIKFSFEDFEFSIKLDESMTGEAFFVVEGEIVSLSQFSTIIQEKFGQRVETETEFGEVKVEEVRGEIL